MNTKAFPHHSDQSCVHRLVVDLQSYRTCEHSYCTCSINGHHTVPGNKTEWDCSPQMNDRQGAGHPLLQLPGKIQWNLFLIMTTTKKLPQVCTMWCFIFCDQTNNHYIICKRVAIVLFSFSCDTIRLRLILRVSIAVKVQKLSTFMLFWLIMMTVKHLFTASPLYGVWNGSSLFCTSVRTWTHRYLDTVCCSRC